ncbi:MAG: hypothetical protein OXR82_13920 [Gammaproteobacteria bacterium]|nr:hypothetical protein [Gammaproteobacteria bacterium]MDE0259469.1 hypothetical protein [Gammaproteobacteria bacterium]
MKHHPIVLSVALLSCVPDVQEAHPRWREGDVVSERTFLQEESVVIEWRIGGPADATLLDPRLVSAGPGGVTVWDRGRNALVRISREGEQLWSFGGEGGGPGEFRSVPAIVHLPDGGAAVVDNVNQRLTVIGTNGAMARETRLGHDYPFSLAALSDDRLIVLTSATEHPFLLFDGNGSLVDSLSFPWGPYRDMSVIARQGSVLGVGDEWIFGFTAGNGWWRFSGEDVPEAFPYAEHAEFPAIRMLTSRSVVDGREEVTTRARPAEPYDLSAVSFGARGDTLFVHYAGRTDDQRWIIDLFSLSSGAYLATVRLPFWARRIAVGPDVIYALYGTTYPMLAAVRRRPLNPNATGN